MKQWKVRAYLKATLHDIEVHVTNINEKGQ